MRMNEKREDNEGVRKTINTERMIIETEVVVVVWAGEGRDRQTDGKTDGQTDRLVGRKVERGPEREGERLTNIQGQRKRQ